MSRLQTDHNRPTDSAYAAACISKTPLIDRTRIPTVWAPGENCQSVGRSLCKIVNLSAGHRADALGEH